MKEFAFNGIESIQDFQLLTDSTGFLLAKNGQLYSFTNTTLRPIATPGNFKIARFHFDKNGHGAIAGNSTSSVPLQKGNVGFVGLLLLPMVVQLWKNKLKLPVRKQAAYALVLLATVGGISACSKKWQQYVAPDATSRFTTIIRSNQLARSTSHQYVANKGVRAFVALTRSNGQEWQTHEMPTNFYVTALTALGGNYLVGTFANDQAGPVPVHGDGDIWIYGNDSTVTPALANNSLQRPYGLSVNRGINGFYSSAQDARLFVYGTETMPTFPKDETNTTRGNIFIIPNHLRPDYRITDAPDSTAVYSLAESAKGELWVTLEDRRLRVVAGKTVYQPLPAQKLYELEAGTWIAKNPADARSFTQIEFVPGTHRGYLRTATGDVLTTSDDGNTWQPASLHEVRLMHVQNKQIGFLQGPNTLLVASF